MLTPKNLVLEPEEQVALVVRRHGFPVFLSLLPLILLFFVPFIAIPLFSLLTGIPLPEIGSPVYAVGVLTVSAFLLILLLNLFLRWIDYVLDVWVVTNERIINIKQRGLFSRLVGEHKLIRVQDVTSEVHGPFPTMLRFGNVVVQTAGEQGRFIFEEVPRPEEIVRLIFKLHDEAIARQGEEAAEAVGEEVKEGVQQVVQEEVRKG